MLSCFLPIPSGKADKAFLKKIYAILFKQLE